ncbi:MAG: GatB/YqeY domain-containing protein [Betaproteobacteria bacterium]|jgi:uncharacterized protein YqeY|nr:GatB/YqeY domain-containing protein [Rhodocyclaceae bacterium]MCA3142791.1 GatB/YqeY domain-containing protein [Rhodocyclaceae bacterium]MCE2897725.1 GatB/YqeY domain-containing protein [Betaproteobacteria bacterium]
MSVLKHRINEDMKSALRARESARLGAIRLLMAAVKQREVDERKELSDDEVVSVIDKMLKQRRDSISQYQAAGRQDLVEAEQFEVAVLQAYMPESLSGDEVGEAVVAAVRETGASGPQDMGRVMALLKPRLAGRADMALVSGLVKKVLSSA